MAIEGRIVADLSAGGIRLFLWLKKFASDGSVQLPYSDNDASTYGVVFKQTSYQPYAADAMRFAEVEDLRFPIKSPSVLYVNTNTVPQLASEIHLALPSSLSGLQVLAESPFDSYVIEKELDDVLPVDPTQLTHNSYVLVNNKIQFWKCSFAESWSQIDSNWYACRIDPPVPALPNERIIWGVYDGSRYVSAGESGYIWIDPNTLPGYINDPPYFRMQTGVIVRSSTGLAGQFKDALSYQLKNYFDLLQRGGEGGILEDVTLSYNGDIKRVSSGYRFYPKRQ